MGAVLYAIWNLLRHCLNLSTESRKKVEEPDVVWSKENPNVGYLKCSYRFNSNAFDTLEGRKPILRNVMEVLADLNTHLLGVYDSDDEIKDPLVQRVFRRVQIDQMFDLVLTAIIARKPNVKKIQEDIACQLGLTLNLKSNYERVNELIQRIKNEKKILIVLCDLYKELDLGKVAILYGADHRGYKILLTSTTEDVLSNHMHTQKNLMV